MSEKQFTKEDIERVQNTFTKIVARYKIALADAIRRPLGVIPESANGLVSQIELEMAETRRQLFSGEAVSNHSEVTNCSENPEVERVEVTKTPYPYGF